DLGVAGGDGVAGDDPAGGPVGRPRVDAVRVAREVRPDVLAPAVVELRRAEQRDTPDDVAFSRGVAAAVGRVRGDLDVELGRVVEGDAIHQKARRSTGQVDQLRVADAAVGGAQRTRQLPPRIVAPDQRLGSLSVDGAVAHDAGAGSRDGDELLAG